MIIIKIARIAISITVPFFLLILFASLLTSKPYLLLSKGLYESHDNVYFDHDYAVGRIAGYLNYRYDNLEFGIDENDDNIIMSGEDRFHMIDVKNVYTGLRIAAAFSLIIAVSLSYLMYRLDKNEFYKTYKNIYFGPLFFVIFVGGYIIIDFNTAFTVFHNLLFPNGGWTLPGTSVLIILLPEEFWIVSGLIILVLFSISIVSLYYINEKYVKKHTLK